MILEKGIKIFEAAGESGRIAYGNILLTNTESGMPVLRATEGHIIAEVPVELEDGDGFDPDLDYQIPREAFRELLKGRKAKHMTFEPNDTYGSVTVHDPSGQKTVFDLGDGYWPDADEMLQFGPRRQFRVGVNAAYLCDLASAMGVETVWLDIEVPEPDYTQAERELITMGMMRDRDPGPVKRDAPVRVTPMDPVSADGKVWPRGIIKPVQSDDYPPKPSKEDKGDK
jgi:hypothetical protein